MNVIALIIVAGCALAVGIAIGWGLACWKATQGTKDLKDLRKEAEKHG
jgi:hypothetical protein